MIDYSQDLIHTLNIPNTGVKPSIDKKDASKCICMCLNEIINVICCKI